MHCLQPLKLVLFATLSSCLPIVGLTLKSPLEDDFYRAPSDLSKYSNGEIYNQRQIIPDLELDLSLSEVHQIAYKTQDAFGNDSHTVATVFKPIDPANETKLFSYQFWEDSAELDCSPSYSLAKGIGSPDGVTGILDTPIAIEFALIHGWYVVVPDHEGPNSAFIEGFTQGRNGLDGIRAALNFFNFEQNTPTALFGYSGGGSATVWMTNLHETYAPELNIVGAAHGGTPIDLTETINWLDRPDRLFSGFIVGAVDGILNAYPEQNETIWPHLYDNLKTDLLNMKKPGVCILTEVLNYGNQEFHTQMDVDFFTFDPVVYILNRESLLKNVSSESVSTPKFPRYIYHARGDEILPFDTVQTYVDQQCASGANIQFVPWKGDDHLSVEFLGIPDAFQFLLQVFDDSLEQVQCGSSPTDILTLASTSVGDVIGQVIADLLTALDDVTTPLGKIHLNLTES